MRHNPSNWLSNFQNAKLNIIHPDATNLSIISFFLILILLTLQKKTSVSSTLLNPIQTEQLKGWSIFFVVLGHLWIHVATTQTSTSMIFSGDAVGMFLLLSGFGLTMSSRHKKYSFQTYCIKRVKRVMVPYWIITLCICVLDYVLLKSRIPLYDFVMTMSGLNFSPELQQLDYVRWFVTFILFWYLVFFLFSTNLSTKNTAIALLSTAFILFPVHYYILNIGWNKIFFFPIGCTMAFYHKTLQKFYLRQKKTFRLVAVSGFTYAIVFKLLLSNERWHSIIMETIPNIMLSYTYEFNTLLVSFAVIILFAYFDERRLESRLLLFLGKFSYEIFLLHGIFLIKYNPIIHHGSSIYLLLEFSLLILFIALLSVTLSRLTTKIYHAF